MIICSACRSRFTTKIRPADLLTRVTNDIASLSEMFSAGFVSMIGNAFMVSGSDLVDGAGLRLGLIARAFSAAGMCFRAGSSR